MLDSCVIRQLKKMDKKTVIEKVKRYSELVTSRFEVSGVVLFGSVGSSLVRT
jgi:hypothetical protein